MEIFNSCAVAIVTPFHKNGKVNFDAFKNLIDYQIAGGVSAIVVLGTTGESSTISERTKTQIADFAINYIRGRVPVILGAGGNNTKEVICRSRRFARLGANALLQVTPYYNKCTQNGLIQHYTQIAKLSQIPQILYNVPSRTGVNMLPATVAQLAKVPNIVGLKEAGGSLAQLTELLSTLPKDFAVYSGEDENIFTALCLGARGVISVVGNVLPNETSALCNKFFDGDIDGARKIQFELLPLIKALFCEVNPAPVKAALNILGFKAGLPKLPLTPLTQNNYLRLKNILKNYENKN